MIAVWLSIAFAAGYIAHVAASRIARCRAARPQLVEPAPLPADPWEAELDVPAFGSLEARGRFLADQLAAVVVRELERRRSRA